MLDMCACRMWLLVCWRPAESSQSMLVITAPPSVNQPSCPWMRSTCATVALTLKNTLWSRGRILHLPPCLSPSLGPNSRISPTSFGPKKTALFELVVDSPLFFGCCLSLFPEGRIAGTKSMPFLNECREQLLETRNYAEDLITCSITTKVDDFMSLSVDSDWCGMLVLFFCHSYLAVSFLLR